MGPLLVILSAGTRGDVQPYVALGKGLQEAGYRVRLVTHENFAGLVKGHGLSFLSPIALQNSTRSGKTGH